MSLRFRSAQTRKKYFSALLCYSLLLTYVAPFAMAHAQRFSLATGRSQQNGVAPTIGAPEGVFPNLDEVKNRQLPQAIAPSSVPSTMRSRRNPLAPRTVRHVGDPLPSPSPLAFALVRADGAAATTPWIKSGNGNEELLPYLLAWNHSYPTLYQSGYTDFQLHDLAGLYPILPFRTGRLTRGFDRRRI